MKETTSDRTKSTKQVQIIARYEIKRDRSHRSLIGRVAYLIRSSDGTGEYCCTLINGKASGCTCPARKPCYHMKQLEVIEAERVAKNVQKVSAECTEKDQIMTKECPVGVTDDVRMEFDEYGDQLTEDEDALSSERLTREQYDALFDPNYLSAGYA